MSKAKKKARVSPLGTIVILIGIVIAVVGIVCLSLNALSLTVKLTADAEPSVKGLITGFGLAFGAPYNVEVAGFTFTAEPEMNTAVLIFFIVLALGVVAGILAMLLRMMKKRKPALFVGLLAGLLTIVGGVLFFIVPNVVSQDLIDAVSLFDRPLSILGGSAALTLDFGSIIPAIGGILGGAAIGVGSIIR